MLNPERGISFGSLSLPQETNPIPNSSQAPNPDIPLGRERLFHFYQDFLKFGRLDVLDERRRRLIEAFLAPPLLTLNDLRGAAGVTTRERVRQLIVSATRMAWKTLPPTLQDQYPLADLTHLGYSPETRARISQALKGRISPMKGREHSPESKARISQAQRQRWQREKPAPSI